MKRRLIAMLAIVAATLTFSTSAGAKTELTAPTTDPFEEPTLIRMTCYLDQGTTASGCEARKGIIATPREWMKEGYCFQIWAMDEEGGIGDFLGFYEPKDTGYGIETGIGESNILKGKTKGSIELGWSIDMFCENEAEVKEFQSYGDYFYIYIITGCKG